MARKRDGTTSVWAKAYTGENKRYTDKNLAQSAPLPTLTRLHKLVSINSSTKRTPSTSPPHDSRINSGVQKDNSFTENLRNSVPLPAPAHYVYESLTFPTLFTKKIKPASFSTSQ